jgi:hypothetical protein
MIAVDSTGKVLKIAVIMTSPWQNSADHDWQVHDRRCGVGGVRARRGGVGGVG